MRVNIETIKRVVKISDEAIKLRNRWRFWQLDSLLDIFPAHSVFQRPGFTASNDFFWGNARNQSSVLRARLRDARDAAAAAGASNATGKVPRDCAGSQLGDFGYSVVCGEWGGRIRDGCIMLYPIEMESIEEELSFLRNGELEDETH